MKLPVTLAALLVLVGPVQLQAEMHKWTNLTGQTVEAEMIGMDVPARAVQLQTSGGQVYTIPVDKLCAADVAYAAAQWRQMQGGGGKAAPQPPSPVLAPGALPPRFVNRCSEKARLSQITSHGGTAACGTAVAKSLQWLKNQQNADGSWGRGGPKAGYTALVLQCYTGHGEGFDSPDFGPLVVKATDFLIQAAAANPLGIFSASPKSGASAYEHGMATTALGEVYILAKGSSAGPAGLRQAFEKAIEVIIKAQGKQGSWNYYPMQMLAGEPPSSGEDLSVTNWQLQSLLVAREAGLTVPGIDPCIDKAVNYLEAKQTKDGGFGNKNKEAHYNQWHMSGGALLGLQTLGANNNTARIAKGVKFLRAHLTSEPMDWNRSCNLYTWVSNTSAFFRAGGNDWEFYSAQLLPQLLAAQTADGSFTAGKADWPASAASDASYRQALCTLQLEVFYRHAR